MSKTRRLRQRGYPDQCSRVARRPALLTRHSPTATNWVWPMKVRASFLNVTVVHNGTGGIGGTGSGKLNLTNTIVGSQRLAAVRKSAPSRTITALPPTPVAAAKRSSRARHRCCRHRCSTMAVPRRSIRRRLAARRSMPVIRLSVRRPTSAVIRVLMSSARRATSALTSTVRRRLTITVPAEIVAPATSGSGAVVTYSVEATDPGALVKSLSCLPASGATFPVGTTKVECTAVDGHENKATGSFNVTVTPLVATGRYGCRSRAKAPKRVGPRSRSRVNISKARAKRSSGPLSRQNSKSWVAAKSRSRIPRTHRARST